VVLLAALTKRLLQIVDLKGRLTSRPTNQIFRGGSRFAKAAGYRAVFTNQFPESKKSAQKIAIFLIPGRSPPVNHTSRTLKSRIFLRENGALLGCQVRTRDFELVRSLL
jgi:hypothetical protein